MFRPQLLACFGVARIQLDRADRANREAAAFGKIDALGTFVWINRITIVQVDIDRVVRTAADADAACNTIVRDPTRHTNPFGRGV